MLFGVMDEKLSISTELEAIVVAGGGLILSKPAQAQIVRCERTVLITPASVSEKRG